MKKKLLCFLLYFLLLPIFVFAAPQSPIVNLEKVGEKNYVKADDLSMSENIGLIINTFFSLLGLIFIVLILVAGYHYMMAQGDTTKTKNAIASIRHAIVGLLILIGAYAIWYFVFENLISK